MLEVVVKAAIGGSMVVVCALISEMFEPKRFSSIFAASPSVSLASLGVSLLVQPARDLAEAGEGMVLGAIALLCYCLIAVPELRRLGAGRGAGLALLAWFLVAAPGIVTWART